MQELRIYQLIHRDLTGQLSQEERGELLSYKSLPDYEYIFSELSLVWSASKEYFPKQKFDTSAAKAKFMRRLEKEKPTATMPAIERSPFYLRAAAVGIIAIALSWLIYTMVSQNRLIIDASKNVQYAALGDDSEVWLDEGSILRVRDFEKAPIREVELTGEAYFKVADNVEKQFVVNMGNETYAEVVGTSFNARTSPDRTLFYVHVNSGRVRLYNKLQPDLSISLGEAESGRLDLRRKTVQREALTGVYSFFSDELNFKNTPLPLVFDKIGKYFDVTIKYNREQIEKCRVNSPMMKDFGLEEIFDVLRELYPGLEIKRQGQTNYVASNLACN